jgi:G3E family GTPase
MKVCIVGGFLGSGKTTLLMKMAKHVKGNAVLIINEMGEIGVDGATVRNEGYNAVELFDGCICCTLVGTLQNTLIQIKKDFDPELIIIEPTGLALPHKIKEMVKVSMIEPEVTLIVGICDAFRFRALVQKKEDFLRMQLSRSDLFLLNKIDKADDVSIKAASAWLESLNPGTKIIPISGLTGEGLEEAFSEIGI